MSITLYSDVGQQTLTASRTDLTAGKFKSATVTSGRWILYTNPNYNDSIDGGAEENIKILTRDCGEKVDVQNVNGSVYLMPYDVDGIVLFKYCYYGGVNPNPTEYTESCPDITNVFPSGSVAGASSAIRVLSPYVTENWLGYVEKNYDGPCITFEKGKDYPNFEKQGIDNKIQSIRKE